MIAAPPWGGVGRSTVSVDGLAAGGGGAIATWSTDQSLGELKRGGMMRGRHKLWSARHCRVTRAVHSHHQNTQGNLTISTRRSNAKSSTPAPAKRRRSASEYCD